VAAFVVGRKASEPDKPASAGSTATSKPAPIPKDFVTYRDPEAGFTFKLPRDWRRLAGPDPAGPVSNVEPGKVLQRAVFSAGGVDGLKVQVVRTQTPVTNANVNDIKAFTDALYDDLTKETRVLNVQQRSVTINGMPAYYYLYTFKDADSGQDGAHARYFLFQGRSMYMLVFQALPADGFTRLAPVFDQVAESFQTDPDVAK
jgi:hypothetical protein